MQVDAGTGSTAGIQRIHTGAYDAGLADMSALIEYYGNNAGQTRLQMVWMRPARASGSSRAGPVEIL